MIVYNVTVNIDEPVKDEWLEWMKQEHIPDVMKTGLFVEYKILRLLQPKPDDGDTFAIQYFAKSMEDYEAYIKEHAPRLQEIHSKKYEGKFHAFRSILETAD
ncbi:MAG TPA: DUF4286 family protein [Ignavibacteria bacterium]|nr:DUF4286 family protein [Ignavibacteria bacterium]